MMGELVEQFSVDRGGFSGEVKGGMVEQFLAVMERFTSRGVEQFSADMEGFNRVEVEQFLMGEMVE